MKILVVDDEELAREALTSMIIEIAKGTLFEIEILQANNGDDAFEMIVQSRPEVVIADIMMPKTSGIELLSRVNDLEINTIYIFVSASDSFAYAQKAVSLGAFSYLLKPIRKNELEEIITKVRLKLEKEKSNLKEDLKFKKSLQILQRDFLTRLVTTRNLIEALSPSVLSQNLDDIGIHFNYDHFSVILLNIANTIENQDLGGSVKDIFQRNGIYCYELGIENRFCYLLNFEEQSNTQDLISQCCNEIILYLNHQQLCFASIGIGSFTKDLYRLNTSFCNANSALFHLWYKSRACSNHQNNFAFFNADEHNENIIANEINMYEKNLEHALDAFKTSNNTENPFELIKECYVMCFNNYLLFSYDVISDINFRTIMILISFLKKTGLNSDIILGDELSLYNDLNSYKTVDTILSWYKAKIAVIMNAIKESNENSNLKIVNRVKEYVKKNIDKDITLITAAQNVFISPQYLSRLFHQIEGDSFVNYVKKAKIEKAKEMLNQGYKANVVANILGYNDAKYFFKVFKSSTGLSPSSYKKL